MTVVKTTVGVFCYRSVLRRQNFTDPCISFLVVLIEDLLRIIAAFALELLPILARNSAGFFAPLFVLVKLDEFFLASYAVADDADCYCFHGWCSVLRLSKLNAVLSVGRAGGKPRRLARWEARVRVGSPGFPATLMTDGDR